MINDLEYVFILDKKGGAQKISYENLNKIDFKDKLVWLHFDYTNEEIINWIIKKSGINPIAIKALQAIKTRPRVTILKDSLMLSLRGINLNKNSKQKDMIAIRIFINKNFIITTKKRELQSIREIIESLKNGDGPKSSSEFLVELISKVTSKIHDTVENLENRISHLEEPELQLEDSEIKNRISSIRKEILLLRRYLLPQKEAIYKLLYENIWINEYEKIQLIEVTDQVIRYIEELDTIKDRATLIQESLENKLNEQMNNKMYLLSIISAIFLPLGFFTGLLGINLGGIPGSENPNAFYIFCGFLVVIIVFQLMYFKKKKWI